MIPLTLIKAGQSATIKKVGGLPEVRNFLEELGFVEGAFVTIISKPDNNLIIKIKESRVAISRETAQKILV
jgi:ferrous iron transport protein A